MFLLGLFLSLASIPGYTSVSIPAGWAAMSVTLVWTLWREVKWTSLHDLFLATLLFAVVSIAWTTAPAEGVFRLWQLSLMFLAFRLGSSTDDLTPIVKGLAAGCAVSSLLAIGESFGFHSVLHFSGSASSGLFYNPVFLGMTLSLVAIACLSLSLWGWIPILLPGIYLSHSRGAWLMLAVGVMAEVFRRPKLVVISIAVVLLVISLSTTENDIERAYIWHAASSNLSWLGYGTGSFANLYLLLSGVLRRPEYTHNDSLQLIFELGVGSIPLLLLGAICFSRPSAPEWPIFASAVFLSFFTFVFFTPLAMFLAALSAGRLAIAPLPRWSLYGNRLPVRGRYFLQSYNLSGWRRGPTRSPSLSLQQRTP